MATYTNVAIEFDNGAIVPTNAPVESEAETDGGLARAIIEEVGADALTRSTGAQPVLVTAECNGEQVMLLHGTKGWMRQYLEEPEKPKAKEVAKKKKATKPKAQPKKAATAKKSKPAATTKKDSKKKAAKKKAKK